MMVGLKPGPKLDVLAAGPRETALETVAGLWRRCVRT